MIEVTLLGATGSIGRSALDVLERHGERFRLVGLAAHSSVDALLDLCRRFEPAHVALADPSAAAALAGRLAPLHPDIEVLSGPAGVVEVARRAQNHYVMAAIVGAVGVEATLAAAEVAKRLLLANKEALIMAGPLFTAAIEASGCELLPIDSEHNAIFQCLGEGASPHLRPVSPAHVTRLWLTASGGPFRAAHWDLSKVTPEQAVAHPTWSMGRKISVDSATLMNKGLEVIEAHLLFGLPLETIQVVVHPQSVIHSLVEYSDGSWLAQLGQPDMRIPISHALGWPERLASGVKPLTLFDLQALTFEPPDEGRFPCLALARRAGDLGGTAPAVLNAANEVAVEAFLAGRLAFSHIPTAVEATLERLDPEPVTDLEQVLAVDRRARDICRARLARGF
ncbi:MAG: 1-deoxy-D-xylulose-5-phosphate reductoisomerase [Candidatus Competibacterales bacterium]